MNNLIKISMLAFMLGLTTSVAQAAEEANQQAAPQEAAPQAAASAADDAAKLYDEGVQVQAGDKAKAVELWKKSAAAGYGPAMFNLGVAFAQGDGVDPDLNKSKKYLQDATKAYQDPKSNYPSKDEVLARIQGMIATLDQAMNGAQAPAEGQ